MFGWLRRTIDVFGGSPRSGRWPRVRREHLAKQPACLACGRSREVEVHHVVPFHERPEMELDPDNLVTLCAEPCHIVHGHLLDWKRSNPHVREDAARYRQRMLGVSQLSGESPPPLPASRSWDQGIGGS